MLCDHVFLWLCDVLIIMFCFTLSHSCAVATVVKCLRDIIWGTVKFNWLLHPPLALSLSSSWLFLFLLVFGCLVYMPAGLWAPAGGTVFDSILLQDLNTVHRELHPSLGAVLERDRDGIETGSAPRVLNPVPKSHRWVSSLQQWERSVKNWIWIWIDSKYRIEYN